MLVMERVAVTSASTTVTARAESLLGYRHSVSSLARPPRDGGTTSGPFVVVMVTLGLLTGLEGPVNIIMYCYMHAQYIYTVHTYKCHIHVYTCIHVHTCTCIVYALCCIIWMYMYV